MKTTRIGSVAQFVALALVCASCGDDGTNEALPECLYGDEAPQSGDSCGDEYATCVDPSWDCNDHVKCSCKSGLVECEPFPPKDGAPCTVYESIAVCAYGSGMADAEPLCACVAGRWSCAPETCPDERPDFGSACEQNPLLRCDYFKQESQCGYLDIYWHCSCEDGQWMCNDDKEDCPF